MTSKNRLKPSGSVIKGAPVQGEALRRKIAEKAYELFTKRNRAPGRDLEDWLEAERMILRDLGAPHDRRT
ncbi:MAG TPA: DUF2934 domain-containing protein [Candidatus Polarisedimenticolia bacterium]|nr:DUF2934 domain-containing protein [Candidatus Polarisedimenticolia bacterium]